MEADTSRRIRTGGKEPGARLQKEGAARREMVGSNDDGSGSGREDKEGF